MSSDRIFALERALKAVLEAIRFEGADLDRVCGMAVDSLKSSVGEGWEKAMSIDEAVGEITKAKSALGPDKGIRRS